MKAAHRWPRPLGASILLLGWMSLVALPAMAQEDAEGPLVLHKPLIGGFSVSYAGGDREKVYRWTGVTFREEFETLMARHPDALAKGKEAYTYNAMGMIGQLALLGLSVKFLIDAISDANTLSSGQFVDSGSSTADFVMIGAAGAVGITGGLMGRSRLNAGVSLFNEAERASSGGPAGHLMDPGASATALSNFRLYMYLGLSF